MDDFQIAYLVGLFHRGPLWLNFGKRYRLGFGFIYFKKYEKPTSKEAVFALWFLGGIRVEINHQ